LKDGLKSWIAKATDIDIGKAIQDVEESEDLPVNKMF